MDEFLRWFIACFTALSFFIHHFIYVSRVIIIISN